MDQTLQPGQQMWMDIGRLIRESTPDKNGSTLPPDLTSGSYEISDLSNRFVGTLFEGKVIYDKTYGHVTYGCALCCGYSTPVSLWYDPISVLVSGLQSDGVWAWYPCESQYDDVSTAFYTAWGSGDSSVVTVDYYGTHSGVGVGSTTTDTSGVLQSNNVHLYCPTHGYTPTGTANVTPVISSISPGEGLIGNTVAISISGSGFGSNPNILAPSAITVAIQSAKDNQIDATFAISNSIAPGNQAIGVTNTQSNLNSNLVSFYVQVPTTLIRDSDYGSGGLGPVNVITDGSVINIYGDTIGTNQCGVYENIGYLLVDQHTPPLAEAIYGNYDLHEHFSNYSSTVQNQTVPNDVDNPIVLAQTILGDTQYYGKNAPSCPGSNDHETFDQSLSVIIGTSTYPLTIVNHVQRGFYSGTGNLTVTITNP